MSRLSLFAVALGLTSLSGCWICSGTCVSPAGAQSPTGDFEIDGEFSQEAAESKAASLTNMCPNVGSEIVDVSCRPYGT